MPPPAPTVPAVAGISTPEWLKLYCTDSLAMQFRAFPLLLVAGASQVNPEVSFFSETAFGILNKYPQFNPDPPLLGSSAPARAEDNPKMPHVSNTRIRHSGCCFSFASKIVPVCSITAGCTFSFFPVPHTVGHRREG